MFIGSIDTNLRAIVNEMAYRWKGRKVYVGCSGNATVERIVWPHGPAELHGNDVSLYSCALGKHLVGDEVSVIVKDPEWDWLGEYLLPGVDTIATLLLCGEMFKYAGRQELFHRRMVNAFIKDWKRMWGATREKVKAATDSVRLTGFFAGDVLEFCEKAPQDCVFVTFPPTYCLAPHERILTADLQWVPCGELKKGDGILAFDEYPPEGVRCRRWRFGQITRSERAVKDCVRVRLENGDSVVCSSDHPWLADLYRINSGTGKRSWVHAEDLAGRFVHRALERWEPATIFEAGWISGMFDGEGCIARSGTTRSVSWNACIAQKAGPTADRVIDLLARFGFSVGVNRSREDSMKHIRINGGLPEVLRALGVFRPKRLLQWFGQNQAAIAP